MIADGVNQPIGVRYRTRSRQRYERAHGRGCTLQRESVEQSAVNVSVKRGFIFHQVLRFHIDSLYCRPNLQADLHRRRNRRAHIHILCEAVEASCRYRQMVGIERNVRKLKAPIASRSCLPMKTAHRVRNLDRCAGNHAAGGILHYAFNRAGISQLRHCWPGRKRHDQSQNKSRINAETLQHVFLHPFEGFVVECG